MRIVLFLVGLISASIVSAQEATYFLAGEISRNEKPVPYAQISIEGTKMGTLSDQNGKYRLKLKKGNYNLVVTSGNTKKVEVFLNKDTRLNISLDGVEENLEEVFIQALRATNKTPIAYTNLEEDEIDERNLGQDIPVLMGYMPGVVMTSDAGAGIGYTSLRVRGSDASRTNVTINGIPYNDAESQGSFWVNLSDMASSIESLQLQRGVGTSTNGAGAFGASINIATKDFSEKAYAELSNSYGSFNTHKHTLNFSTGLFNQHWEISGRASVLESDGYIDRASSSMRSYFLQAAFIDENTKIKAITFGNKEKTYQAWYGIDANQLKEDRRYNPAGEYTTDEGVVKYYDNQTDNYWQDHYQLLWNQTYDSRWSSNFALHYTRGKGYYEEFQEDASLNDYNLPSFTANGELVETSDLINTKWLDNHFYGTTFSVQYNFKRINALIGGGANRYEGDHFGEVIYTRFAQNKEPYAPYYDNDAVKTDANLYTKISYALSNKLNTYIDLQGRWIGYETNGAIEEGIPLGVDEQYSFFNPKFGLTYQPAEDHQLYFSYAKAHREPSRSDFENALFNNADVEPESLDDFEWGWRWQTPKLVLNANFYYMNYKNQLVLTGEIDAEGGAVRENVGDSYRAGIELDASIKLANTLSLHPNVAISRNQNRDFKTRFDGELQNFGNTEIAFSPSVVAANAIRFSPVKNLQINWLSKYVGEQYMSNLEREASRLDDYFINDLNLQYVWEKPPFFNEIVFTGLVNNIFNVKYVSNGYYFNYEVENTNIPSGLETLEGAGYYPQATINFLFGINLKF
ncbi:TonB-dependent receptor [Mesonia sediminis]|uniref:TonB-dependent receptor n=1 Tax=Mesonia sediminis TaxID=1703946 RepID=A0ABW5SIF2_9FLAO